MISGEAAFFVGSSRRFSFWLESTLSSSAGLFLEFIVDVVFIAFISSESSTASDASTLTRDSAPSSSPPTYSGMSLMEDGPEDVEFGGDRDRPPWADFRSADPLNTPVNLKNTFYTDFTNEFLHPV